jgi:hypothetical protein
MVSRSRFFFGMIALLSCGAGGSLAQDYRAKVVGLVMDSNKAAVPGAALNGNERSEPQETR